MLAAKAELLKVLDAEIVNEVQEDELETEIENTDMTQERIDLKWTHTAAKQRTPAYLHEPRHRKHHLTMTRVENPH